MSAQDPGGFSGAFPVTITTVLALGEVPVAMAEVTYVDGGVQEWTNAALDGEDPETFNADVDIPIEQIAALEPDLILGAGSYNLEPAYDKLSQIAVAATREANPALEGKSVGIFNFVEQPYVINSRDDSSIKFLETLENLDPLDTDVLIGTSGDGTLAQLEESTLFQGLDIGAATSMAFPSALSVQWALDNVVPEVVAAAER